MKKLEIFDPAMCCQTGVCGPATDPELLRVAAVIGAMRKMGAEILRYNAASQPEDFVNNKPVAAILEKEGADVLPVTVLDGKIVKAGEYPTNDEFAKWLGVKISDEANDAPGDETCRCDSSCC
jgi:hypothetical protein